MESLPRELCLKIFQFLDHQSLATALQVCRKWKILASDDTLWYELFKERWGCDRAEFYAPQGSNSWKDVYIIQDRCDRYGLGLKIIKEGSAYYLIHQGDIQRYLGSSKHTIGANVEDERNRPSLEISERILFFIGDLEAACANDKRIRTS